MKKHTFNLQPFAVSFCSIGFLFTFLYSCSKNETSHPDGNNISGKTKNGSNFSAKTLPANEHSIDVADAKAFIRSFYQHATSRMTEEEKQLLATSVYFPLDALENYINAMKQYNANSSGLRVYFARYNKSHVNSITLNDTTLALDHEGTNTVIFVATEKDKDGYPVDIIGQGAYQPFNAGISCPPMPPSYCKGLYCPLIED